MNTKNTIRLTAQPGDLKHAADLLSAGKLVAFPTETVYGLGGDACDDHAVASIFAAKGRPSFNPLIAHVASTESARRHVLWTDTAESLANAFWPGPLTLVLPLRDGHTISSLVTAGLGTLAVRVPEHATARSLLQAFDGPVAAPSANPSGRISPTTADHVMSGLAGRISAVVDDGPCEVGLESTIVGLVDDPVLLRPGGLDPDLIEDALLGPLRRRASSEAVTAPGQLASHYAPEASVRLNAVEAAGDEILLGFGNVVCDLNLSASADLAEAAAHLFAALHTLNETGRPIAVTPIPELGLGRAINDRLRRAAAPRQADQA